MTNPISPLIEIRPARLGDSLALAILRVRSWQAAYAGLIEKSFLDQLSIEQNEQRFREQLVTTTNTRHLVAIIDKRITGWSCSTVSNDDGTEDTLTGELNALYVLPNAWGNSLGYTLWQATCEHLRNQGCSGVTAWVLAHNERAERFYERQGFRRQPRQKHSQLTATQTLVENMYALKLTR